MIVVRKMKRIKEVTVVKDVQSTEMEGGYVNTTPKMTCVRGAKVCTKWLQEESDDQITQPDNKLELGTSYKLKLGPR